MKKILVIEDDCSVRSSTSEILKEEGFEVLEAENGQIGIQLARKYLPDLILSDILMPGLDGYSVLDELQKDVETSSIPFIFLTAKSENCEVRNSMKKGADDYITKPYKASHLLDTVNFRLSKRRFVDLKLDELYGTVAHSLPHELRTPLVSILGFSDFIKNYHESLENKEIIQMVGKIHSAGERLHKTIQKFLLLSELVALQSDNEHLASIRKNRILNVNQLINSVSLKTAMIYGRSKDIKLKLAKADVSFSEEYFSCMITELIDNCIKFSKKDSAIEINSFCENGSYVTEFRDYGIGINHSKVKNIGLFSQYDRCTFNQPGMGIGLALVRKVLEIHHGTFEIESNVGEYTLARITVPLLDSNT